VPAKFTGKIASVTIDLQEVKVAERTRRKRETSPP
jgi:hypothetical protein